ncbi:class A beta-lactamase [Iodidimonas sp. SYSU 1G8]|uniref:class A beta-lactamase n=1 Tax=Iodidimonas sp. SYSU 1G8 TaxID=3133967 RepID=UPI0031FF05F2
MLSRRSFLRAGLSLSVTGLIARNGLAGTAAFDGSTVLAKLEATQGGRLGVAALDTATGSRIDHRADERFPLCSTFKFLAAAYVLARVDAGDETLDRVLTYGKGDIVAHSPATAPRLGTGMTIGALCEATMTLSDNTAANLLLATFGGPEGLTRYLRSLGDDITRLDRIEPALNEATPGDPRDTTSPAAMLATMHRLLLGDALSPASRRMLTHWLVANQTGDNRIRAGVPAAWKVGDKTGGGAYGTTNDISILWPQGRAPVLLAVYLTETNAAAADREATIAQVARTISKEGWPHP